MSPMALRKPVPSCAPRAIRWSGLAALLLLAISASASAQEQEQERPKLGVLDFGANGTSEQLAAAIGGVAANEIQRLGLFEVITAQAIRELLNIERQKQLLGCNDESCATELADVLGMDYVVSGKVSRIEGKNGMPTTFTLEMTLLDSNAMKRVASDIQLGQSEAELMGKVGKSVTKLLASLLEGRSGDLIVDVSERGAVVKVDDVVVGTTPLSGRLTLPGGPHFLAVEKDGFVAYQKQVRIEPAGLVEERIFLVPSPDYVRRYEADQGRLRLAAWLSTGIAVLGAGTAGYLQWDAGRTFGDADTNGTFAYHQGKVVAGIETEDGVDHRFQANLLRDRIQFADTLSWVGVGVGAAAAGAAAYFWIVGDDPGRYARYRGAGPRVGFVPARGGGAAVVGFDF